MYANLAQLRASTLDLRATEGTGSEQNVRLRRAFNLAYNRFVGDVPKAFFVDKEHLVVRADVQGSDTASESTAPVAYTRRYMNTTLDVWVLEFVDSTGNYYPTGGVPTGAWSPTLDGSWDGVMHIEYVDENGKLHRRQSREWWLVDDQVHTHLYVSVDRPVTPNSTLLTKTPVMFDFRIHQPEIWLPQECIRIYWPVTLFDESQGVIGPIQENNAAVFQMPDFRGYSNGTPSCAYRTRAFQIPAPDRIPTAEAIDNLDWLGPEPKGKFRFKYTRVWGRRPDEHRDAPGGVRDPVWESAPSPESAQFDHGIGHGVIQINVPDIDFMQNFGDAATLRYSRTGYRTRIYVARASIDASAPPFGLNPMVEADENYYFLAEIDGSDTYYRWYGDVIPDYFRRLHHSSGYQGYSLYPHQDEEYILDFQVARLPDFLYGDQDTPYLRLDAIPTLVEIFLHYVALMDGNDQAGAQAHLGRYTDMVPSTRARYENAAAVIVPIPFSCYGSLTDLQMESTFTKVQV